MSCIHSTSGIPRRNSSTPSLRQFLNSSSPLIEEDPDEEEKAITTDEEGDDDEEGFSENPVS